MKPITFKGHNVIYAEKQDEYLDLPAYRQADGSVTSCWSLSFLERVYLLFTGRIYWTQLTFGKNLQPQRAELTNPYKEEKNDADA